jgi:hypothetical protein
VKLVLSGRRREQAPPGPRGGAERRAVRPAWARNRRWESSGDPDGGNPSPTDKGVTARERLVEVVGAVPNRAKAKRQRRTVTGELPALSEALFPSGDACVEATGWHEVSRSYLGRSLGLRGARAQAVAIKDERTR